MIVVADSGPLHYLILLEHVDLLRRFYGQVPERVASELSAAGTPGVVREWITKPPTWVDVRTTRAISATRILGASPECAQSLCKGLRIPAQIRQRRRFEQPL